MLSIGMLAVGTLQAMVANKVVAWSPWLVVWVAFGVGAITFLDNVRLIRHKFRAHERNAAKARMYRPMFSALCSVSEARQVKLLEFGISIFRITPCWYLRWKLVPWRQQRLVRLVRLRLSDNPNESAVVWTKGKGAIGECWADQVPVLHDRRSAAVMYGRSNYPDQQQYDAMSAKERRGMTRAEFIQTIDKYGEILAVPVVAQDSGKIIGVVSMDCLASAYEGVDSPSILGGQDIEAFAVRTARLTRDDLVKF